MKALQRAVAIPLLCLAVLSLAAPAAAQTVPFKVYITELWQLDTVDTGLGYIGDYYASVTINGASQSNSGACDDPTSGGIIVPFQLFKNFSKVSDCSHRTPWAFTRQLTPGGPITVKIQVFDSDLAFDDEGDAIEGPGSAIEITIDPASGQWSGNVNWPQTCSRPNLSGGGNNVNVCFQAGFDTDDDGLLDVWERLGVDTDNDGVVNLDLAALGANPLRKDAFVEIDHLQAGTHTHAPLQTAAAMVVASFANAPVANPDGTTGIQLHLDVGAIYPGVTVVTVPGAGGAVGTYGNLGGGNAIGEAGNLIIESFSDPFSAGTKFADLKAANYSPVRDPIFRYAIFGHQTNARKAANDCTSGVATSTRLDFMVTLGGVDSDNDPCRGTDPQGHSVGTFLQQAGTLMHELGHALGLLHGGEEDVNNKPNYLSVMNYSFQACGVPQSAGLLPGICDYSRLVQGVLLPPLTETNLDECVGIGGGLGLGLMDWNANGIIEGVSQCGPIFSNTTADANDDGICIKPGPNGILDTPIGGDDATKRAEMTDGPNRVCNTPVAAGTDDVQATAVGSTPSQPATLTSFDDWARVTPALMGFTNGFGTGSGDLDQEPDAEELEAARLSLSRKTTPGIVLDQTGPATGKPGDVLTYVANVTNTGRGPALSAVLTQISPDATAHVTEPGTIAVGTQVMHTMTFTVPAAACPGSFTGATSTLAFKDFAAVPLIASDTVALQILDVAAPSVEVTLSLNGLWAPNHKFQQVQATIVVTDNCDPNPAVRLVSIVSNEPATGVIGQGDKGPDVEGAAYGTDDRTFGLRSERGTGRGDTGRVYTVRYRVTDTSGNSTEKTATVTVPTSNSGK